MYARPAQRLAAMAAARRPFSRSARQLGSPYHYPEGPRSNIPFNPLTRFFWLRYWGFMGESRATLPYLCVLVGGLVVLREMRRWAEVGVRRDGERLLW